MSFIFPQSYLSGLTLSTAGGSTTFSVALGQASDSTNAAIINLAAAMSKTSASWAVGTAVGALDTGAIAPSTWYYVHLIQTTDTFSSDILISLSSTAPTLPSGYPLFRRIGAMRTDGSSNWTKFLQNGDDFFWDAPVVDVSNNALTTTSTLFSLTVPVLSVKALISALFTSTTINSRMLIQSPLLTTQVVNVPSGNQTLYVAAANGFASGNFNIQTNASGQIRAVGDGIGTASFYVTTIGWTDRRGRDQ